MCNPAAAMIGGSVIGAASSYSQAKDNAKAVGQQIAAQNATKVQMVKSMNYDLANLSQEQRDQYDQAIAQMQANSINAIRNQGMLRSAFGESGVEGRSVNQAMREVEGQESRVKDAIRGSYADSFAGIQQQKEAAVLNADAQIRGLPTINKPSSTSVMLGIVSGAMNGASAGASVYSSGANMGLYGSKGGK